MNTTVPEVKRSGIDPKLAKQHGIQLDQSGWPTESSLKAWYAKNNPPTEAEEPDIRIEISFPTWLLILTTILIAIGAVLKFL